MNGGNGVSPRDVAAMRNERVNADITELKRGVSELWKANANNQSALAEINGGVKAVKTMVVVIATIASFVYTLHQIGAI